MIVIGNSKAILFPAGVNLILLPDLLQINSTSFTAKKLRINVTRTWFYVNYEVLWHKESEILKIVAVTKQVFYYNNFFY